MYKILAIEKHSQRRALWFGGTKEKVYLRKKERYVQVSPIFLSKGQACAKCCDVRDRRPPPDGSTKVTGKGASIRGVSSMYTLGSSITMSEINLHVDSFSFMVLSVVGEGVGAECTVLGFC